MAKAKDKGKGVWELRQESLEKAVAAAKAKLDGWSGDDPKERRALHKKLKRAQRRLTSCSAEAARRAKEGPKASEPKAAEAKAAPAPPAEEKAAPEAPAAGDESPPAEETPAEEEG